MHFFKEYISFKGTFENAFSLITVKNKSVSLLIKLVKIPYNFSSLSSSFIFSVITSVCTFLPMDILFLMSKQNYSVKSLKKILSFAISKLVHLWVAGTSLSWWIMLLCESCVMMFSRSWYIVAEIYVPFLAVNECNFPWGHRHFLLSTRYDIFYNVGFLSLLSFSRRLIVNSFLFHHYPIIIFCIF